jgi:hypothetical protein
MQPSIPISGCRYSILHGHSDLSIPRLLRRLCVKHSIVCAIHILVHQDQMHHVSSSCSEPMSPGFSLSAIMLRMPSGGFLARIVIGSSVPMLRNRLATRTQRPKIGGGLARTIKQIHLSTPSMSLFCHRFARLVMQSQLCSRHTYDEQSAFCQQNFASMRPINFQLLAVPI